MKKGRFIHWSDEDKLFIATLPDFPNCSTHGKSYEEALQNAQEVLDMRVQFPPFPVNTRFISQSVKWLFSVARN
jgi:hypothetical protein